MIAASAQLHAWASGQSFAIKLQAMQIAPRSHSSFPSSIQVILPACLLAVHQIEVAGTSKFCNCSGV
jgi:hypothetical protein